METTSETQRVLVIDDEAEIADTLTDILTMATMRWPSTMVDPQSNLPGATAPISWFQMWSCQN